MMKVGRIEKILDDLKLAQERRAANRDRLRGTGHLVPVEFNKITKEIATDSQAINKLLDELTAERMVEDSYEEINQL